MAEDERATQPQGGAPEISMSAVLDLPEPQRRLVNWLMRSGPASMAEIVAQFTWDEASTRAMLDELSTAGFLRPEGADGSERYRARVNSRPNRRLAGDIWKALDS